MISLNQIKIMKRILRLCPIILLLCASCSKTSDKSVVHSFGQTPASVGYYYLNDTCESLDGQKITINNYYLLENTLVVEGDFVFVNMKNELLLEKPTCINVFNGFAIDKNLTFDVENTLKYNSLNEFLDSSFSGLFYCCFATPSGFSLNEDNPIAINFHIIHTKYTYNYFILAERNS